ncbi:MAG: outer membrane beta-barrel protein [Candidatus Saganbacteria bacterium]|nr:outer membrane beta-barrel protein [Candidatus Saganbacteria bacterium]
MADIQKKQIFFFVAVLIILSAVTSSSATGNSLNMIAGVGAGYAHLFPKDVQVKDFYKGGITYRGFLGFKARSGLSVIGEISYFSEGNRSAIAPLGTALSIIPITASVAYHPLKDSLISPYFGAGVGIYNINESDPDYTYVSETKFGKHLFVGADIYFDQNSVLRAELKQSFIDPLNSPLYYKASFGGLTATLNLAVELPLTTPDDGQKQVVVCRRNENYSHYGRRSRNHRGSSTAQQSKEEKEAAEKLKIEQEKKRQEYIKQKQKLRQEKKVQ